MMSVQGLHRFYMERQRVVMFVTLLCKLSCLKVVGKPTKVMSINLEEDPNVMTEFPLLEEMSGVHKPHSNLSTSTGCPWLMRGSCTGLIENMMFTPCKDWERGVGNANHAWRKRHGHLCCHWITFSKVIK